MNIVREIWFSDRKPLLASLAPNTSNFVRVGPGRLEHARLQRRQLEQECQLFSVVLA